MYILYFELNISYFNIIIINNYKKSIIYTNKSKIYFAIKIK